MKPDDFDIVELIGQSCINPLRLLCSYVTDKITNIIEKYYEYFIIFQEVLIENGASCRNFIIFQRFELSNKHMIVHRNSHF